MTQSMKFKNECHPAFCIEYRALIHIASKLMQIFCCKIEENKTFLYSLYLWRNLKNCYSKNQTKALKYTQEKYIYIHYIYSVYIYINISSVQLLSCVSLWPHGPQCTRPLCPSLTPGACPNSWPSGWWYHPTNASSVIPFSSYIYICMYIFVGEKSKP